MDQVKADAADLVSGRQPLCQIVNVEGDERIGGSALAGEVIRLASPPGASNPGVSLRL